MRAVTWSGTLLFAAALGLWAYRYAVTFADAASSTSNAVAVMSNVALFTAFALHHSIFARTPVRTWIARRAPDLERSIYVWIASALFIAVCLLWQPVAGVAWQASGVSRWILWALQAAGVVLTLRGAAVLDVRELAGLTQLPVARTLSGPRGEPDKARPTGMPEQSPYKTTGPYGWVRHPIYSGWFLMVLCATPMTMTRLVFGLVSCAYLVAAIPFEEGTLRRTSGGAYDAYIKRVKWKLIPGIF